MYKLHLRRPLAFFDLETTGTNVCKDRIVELSILKLTPDGEYHTKSRRVNPTIPIPYETTLIHGIADEDVRNEPFFRQIAKGVAQFLDGCDLGGFNITKFDLPLLIEEFDRAGVDFEYEDRRIVDAQKIFFAREPRNLAAAFKFYTGDDISTIGKAHTAVADTYASYRVFLEQVRRYEQDISPDQSHPISNDIKAIDQTFNEGRIDLAGFFSRDSEGRPIFSFGKHKGELVQAILAKNPGFYNYFMQGEYSIDTKRHLTRIKLAQLA